MRPVIAAGLSVVLVIAAEVFAFAAMTAPAPLPRPQAVEEPILLEVPGPSDAEEDLPAPLLAPVHLPPEVPDATLTVRLLDAATGYPVAMSVVLWRLGLPEDEHWTEGDLKVASIFVGRDGKSVNGLVPGRYRLSCTGQRKDTEDPPEFTVLSGENETAPPLTMARTLKVHLLVYDEDGGRLESANCLTTITTRVSSERATPSWAHDRAEKLPDGSFGWSSVGFSARA